MLAPSTPSTPQRRAKQARKSQTSHSSTPSRTHSSAALLSTSEPTLRFPRPVGSRHLANWISSSDPDIMEHADIPAVGEDDTTILAESTYDIISTDTESVDDGNYTESMSASMSSLDFQRLDDVVSLAGTEATYEENDLMNTTESQLIAAVTAEMVQSIETAILHHSESEEEEEEEEDDDAESRSSLEYTDQSLQTPSLTPEASRVFAPMTFTEYWRHKSAKFIAKIWRVAQYTSSHITDNLSSFLPGLIFMAITAILMPFFYNPMESTISSTNLPLASVAKPTNEFITTTTTTTTTTAKELLVSTIASTANSVQQPTLATGVALIPLSTPSEGIFRSRKAVVSFTPQGKYDVLAHIREDVKNIWIAKDCLTITATRGGAQPVAITTSSVDDGILLQFPRRETYGIITLLLTATCRPKTSKEIKVHFGKGIMVEAFERGKQLAQEVSVAAQEAEKRLYNVQSSFRQSFAGKWHLASVHLRDRVGDTTHQWHHVRSDLIDKIFAASRKAVGVTRCLTHDISRHWTTVNQDVTLEVLSAQVQAKMWWLKLTKQERLYGEYEKKATRLFAEKRAVNRMTQESRHSRYQLPLGRRWKWLRRATEPECSGPRCLSTHRGCTA